VHILDNEALARFKEEIRKNCDLQLVSLDTHRRNLAKRTIQTFKSHFIAIMAGLDPSFPMTLWDRLLPQPILTLNLLRQAIADVSMSAYQFMHGEFDYNKMPLAPLGCAVQIHESTNRQKRGMCTHSMGGIWVRPTNITGATQFIAQKQGPKEFPILFSFSIVTLRNL
jgi:hypothetical protein